MSDDDKPKNQDDGSDGKSANEKVNVRSLVARAKEWAAVPATRREKTEFIMNMMRNLEWVRGKSAGILAEQWGMEQGSVENISSEASRRVLAEIEDPDRLKLTGLTKLEKIIDDSLIDAAVDPDSAVAHRKVASDGIHKLLTLTGAAAPQKVQLEVERLSDTEVDARLAALAAKLKGLLGRGEDE